MMRVGEVMAQWQRAADGNARLQHLGRHCTLSILILFDQDPWFLSVDSGCLVKVDQGPFHMRASDLMISGPMTSWEKFFSAMPPRGFHDLLAMSSYGHVQIQGNQALLREHLAFIKALFDLPRTVAEASA